MENLIFKQRLAQCVEHAGGILLLAARSGVSRAQLHRYLRGSSVPTLKKVEAIAQAAGVQASWLVSGQKEAVHKAGQVVLDQELFLEALEKVENVIQKRGFVLPPRRKALFVFAITKAAEQTKQAARAFLLSEGSIFSMVDFMCSIPDDDKLKFLFEGMEGNLHWDHTAIDAWEKLFCQAHVAFCDTLSNRNYFERLQPITGALAQNTLNLLEKVQTICPNLTDILDLGCGNGRYLQFFHQQNPKWRLCGVDVSFFAAQFCRALEAQNLLPAGTFHQADMRYLPFNPNSFDFVLARNSLFSAPLTPNHLGGLDAIFSSIYKILRPGGVFHGMSRYGKGISFFIGQQLFNEEMVQALCQRHGFIFMGCRRVDVNKSLFAGKPHAQVHEGFADYITFELAKPLAFKKHSGLK